MNITNKKTNKINNHAYKTKWMLASLKHTNMDLNKGHLHDGEWILDDTYDN